MIGAHRDAPFGLPIDLDDLLLSDQVQRQLSPTALRNQGAGVGDFGIAERSPIAELASPQTTMLALEAAVHRTETTVPAMDSPIGQGSGFTKVGR